jgi:hypothetical protein
MKIKSIIPCLFAAVLATIFVTVLPPTAKAADEKNAKAGSVTPQTRPLWWQQLKVEC